MKMNYSTPYKVKGYNTSRTSAVYAHAKINDMVIPSQNNYFTETRIAQHITYHLTNFVVFKTLL